MSLIYHPDAEAELIEAAQVYEGKVVGLGVRFLNEFDTAIAQIQAAPSRWRFVEEGLRRYVMNSFPYSIYYRIEGDDVRVLVVKHHSRHPDYWRYRLDS
jgi:plasmid stabilization system protein ParE